MKREIPLRLLGLESSRSIDRLLDSILGVFLNAPDLLVLKERLHVNNPCVLSVMCCWEMGFMLFFEVVVIESVVDITIIIVNCDEV